MNNENKNENNENNDENNEIKKMKIMKMKIKIAVRRMQLNFLLYDQSGELFQFGWLAK